MAKSILPTNAPEKPLTALSGADRGKAPTLYSFAEEISPADVWATAKQVWGDEVPENTCLAIWGLKVVDARRTEDCPECGWAGSVFVLCPYHQYRQCECGAILGTVTQCSCDGES